MTSLAGNSILVTSGIGSFGRLFGHHALDHLESPQITVLSGDNSKQHERRRDRVRDLRVRFSAVMSRTQVILRSPGGEDGECLTGHPPEGDEPGATSLSMNSTDDCSRTQDTPTSNAAS